jgi:hypothetical protein
MSCSAFVIFDRSYTSAERVFHCILQGSLPVVECKPPGLCCPHIRQGSGGSLNPCVSASARNQVKPITPSWQRPLK